MEKYSGMTNAVLLLDDYKEDARMLHQSFRNAGFKGMVVVIEDEGFFPEDVIPVYQYFCGAFQKNVKVPGKARHFNEIQVPDYWEVSGNNASGKVQDLHRERGRIFYAEPKHKRLVRTVDWLDENGTVRSSDHYNQCGALYARTFLTKTESGFARRILMRKGAGADGKLCDA